MRSSLALLAMLALAACGGSPSTPETPATTAAPVADPAPAATATADIAPAPIASSAPSAPPAPVRTPPTLDGAIGGKPFHGVAACLAGKAVEGGKVYVEIYSVKDMDVKTSCGRLPPTPDSSKIGVLLPWTDGAKLDVSTIKASKDPQLFVMSSTANPKKFDRKDAGKEMKPTGTIEVLRAGKKGDVARIKLDLTVGKDKLAGEIDVEVMADPS